LTIKRHFKDRTGIGAVSTAILLFVALLAVVGIYFIWQMVQSNAGNAIYIQNVAFQPTKTIIYVQNIGNGTVTIDVVQINDQTFGIQKANCTVASQETTTVTQGQTAQITINQAYNEEVHIKVICKNGTFHESWYKPPLT
jgi:hypothetical protein